MLDADYETINGKAVVRLLVKTQSGELKVLRDPSFKPYFYLLPDGSVEAVKKKALALKAEEFKVESIEEIEKSVYGEKKKLLKIFASHPCGVG